MLNKILLFLRSRFFVVFFIIEIVMLIIVVEVDRIKIAQTLKAEADALAYRLTLVQKQQEGYADIFYDEIINQPPVLELIRALETAPKGLESIYRKKLYSYLLPIYKRMQEHNVRQLHFHYSDSRSLLRMHRPDKFGDQLKDIRFTVHQVNTIHKKVTGFEEGRIFNGFRYVYPLEYAGSHLGSVEISASAEALNQLLTENYAADTHFMIKKSVVDSKVWENESAFYISSQVSDNYLIEKRSRFNEQHQAINEVLKTRVQEKIDLGLNFSEFVHHDNQAFIVSFVAQKNASGSEKAAAYFVSFKTDTSIDQSHKEVIIAFIAVSILNLIFNIMLLNAFETKKRALVQQEIIFQQTKMAKMGELLSLISHQWKQPLNALSSSIVVTRFENQMGKLTSDNIDLRMQKMEETIKHLANTMDEFKDFYNPHREKRIASVAFVIEQALAIIKPNIDDAHVEIVKQIDEVTGVKMFSNEIMQVIMVACQNSLEIFKERKIETPKIEITVTQDQSEVTILIEDNGKGMSEAQLSTVFTRYHSHKIGGTGLGLYMSQIIVCEHHQGSYEIFNNKYGLSTKIVLEVETV